MLLRDPRLHLEYGDGRQALTRGEILYDVIEADAVHPQISHSGLLYSAEFLEQMKARLASGGIYVQFAPTPRVVDTFAAVFPYAVLLRPFPVLIGSKDPIPFNHDALLQRLAEPAVLAHIRRGNPAVVSLTERVAGEPFRWTPESPRIAPPLTDLFPHDEFFINQATDTEHAWRPPVAPPIPDNAAVTAAVRQRGTGVGQTR